MKQYVVTYERDPQGWWLASVNRIKGCHTQGRTIDQARRRIREALALFVSNAEKATLVDDIKLPARALHALNEFKERRKKAEDYQSKAQLATEQVAKILTAELKLSVRDAGEILEISHQRVQQLASR